MKWAATPETLRGITEGLVESMELLAGKRKPEHEAWFVRTLAGLFTGRKLPRVVFHSARAVRRTTVVLYVLPDCDDADVEQWCAAVQEWFGPCIRIEPAPRASRVTSYGPSPL